MEKWILNNLNWLIPTVVIPPVVWFFSKRHQQVRNLKKEDVHIESNQSEVVSKNLELYQRMLDDVEKRYELRLSKQDQLIAKQEEEIRSLKERIKQLEEK